MDPVGHPATGGRMVVLQAIALAYLSMALLSLGVYERAWAGTWPTVWRAIRVIGWPYAALCIAMLLLSLIRRESADLLWTVPVIGPVLTNTLTIYALIVEMAWLGLLYRTHEGRLPE